MIVASEFVYKAIFNFCGNMPVVSDWFTVSVNGITRYSLISFINKLEISSCSELFFGAK